MRASSAQQRRDAAVPLLLVAAAFVTWRIQGGAESEFRNWAAPTYGYVREHYRFVGGHLTQEIYCRVGPGL